ncbi:MAG: RecX family transcriptional regulator [Bacilli bacterium]|nr:RecX family transcriptional regulator [Bacilli bacterium]MDD4547615.1 RecX family transcriptional regulator [Bacilli bacterium]
MRIEKIKKLNSGKYKIIIEGDEDLITYDDVILKNKLLTTNKLDKDLLLKLNVDTEYYNTYSKVINYIQTRLRSEKEIDVYLEKFQISNAEKTKIKDDLKTGGYINDTNFAKAYIGDKMNLSSEGPNKIRKGLKNHDIDDPTIELLISEIDESDVYDKLYRLIHKKIASNHKYSKYQLREKIINNFMGLGYDISLINQIFEELYIEDSDILNKEYNKIYNNLRKKYQGDELYFKIRQKLYQKGYKNDEIAEVINNNIA